MLRLLRDVTFVASPSPDTILLVTRFFFIAAPTACFFWKHSWLSDAATCYFVVYSAFHLQPQHWNWTRFFKNFASTFYRCLCNFQINSLTPHHTTLLLPWLILLYPDFTRNFRLCFCQLELFRRFYYWLFNSSSIIIFDFCCPSSAILLDSGELSRHYHYLLLTYTALIVEFGY